MADNVLDIFRGDAFGLVPLTDFINNLKFVPGYISSTGIFAESGVTTTAIAIEERNFELVMVAPSARGGPGVTVAKPRRGMRMLQVPHFEINDAVMAEEVQGVRAFGTADATETVMGKVGERLQVAGQSLEQTQEYARVGAIKGIITYADGSTLDLFREYDIAVPSSIDFNLDATNPTDGVLRGQLATLTRTIGANLDGIAFNGIMALCGDDFFDLLVRHPEVRKIYLAWLESQELRNPYVAGGGQIWGSFQFGGVNFVNYRGNIGANPMIEKNMCYFFPTGVPNLFRTYYAPADYMETVNTMGVARYTKQYPMPNDKGVHVDTQMNALNICTRPLALQRGVMS